MRVPLVSVIMPAYNSEKYIEKAIDSVFIQKLPLELIIIDDCSTDQTCDVIRKYLDYPEVIYLRNQKNLGVAASRNRGVLAARGEFVAFLDADDWWQRDKLSKQLEMIHETGAVLCSTARALMSPEGEASGKIIAVREYITYQMMLRQNWLNCSAVVVRTEVAKEFPMKHDDSHEDYITWMQILRKYKFACAVNEPLLNYRLSTVGKSGPKTKSAKMMYRAYRYIGFGPIRSVIYFVFYAVNGIRKYYID